MLSNDVSTGHKYRRVSFYIFFFIPFFFCFSVGCFEMLKRHDAFKFAGCFEAHLSSVT